MILGENLPIRIKEVGGLGLFSKLLVLRLAWFSRNLRFSLVAVQAIRNELEQSGGFWGESRRSQVFGGEALLLSNFEV